MPIPSQFSFTKHALVTGASRGIGKAISELLLQRAFSVVGTSRSGRIPSLEQNPEFSSFAFDFEHPSNISSSFNSLFYGDKPPNVVVLNAGISEACSFESTEEDWESHWEKTMNVNLFSPVNLAKVALQAWKDQKIAGILIAISSRASYRGDTEPFSAYAASKGGLTAFMKTVSRSFGKDYISAVTIAPGFIRTEMAEMLIPEYGEEYLSAGIALGEITAPEEVGEVVASIAEGTMRHLTGSTIHINGGSYVI